MFAAKRQMFAAKRQMFAAQRQMFAAQAVRHQTNTALVTRAGIWLRMCVKVFDQRTGEPVNVDPNEHGALGWLNITNWRL